VILEQVVIEKRQSRYPKGNYKLMRDNFQKIKWEEFEVWMLTICGRGFVC
jgi:hypothetical protein